MKFTISVKNDVLCRSIVFFLNSGRKLCLAETKGSKTEEDSLIHIVCHLMCTYRLFNFLALLKLIKFLRFQSLSTFIRFNMLVGFLYTLCTFVPSVPNLKSEVHIHNK